MMRRPPGKGVGELFEGGQVSRMIGTHIGLNPKAQQQMLGKQITVDLIPQGTFVERIRAGGCGLGGVLTPTGWNARGGRQTKDCGGRQASICSRPRYAPISRWCMHFSPTIPATSPCADRSQL